VGRQQIRIRVRALIGGLGLLVLGAAAALAPPAQADGGFAPRPSPIESGRLFDLGVADRDGDGRQELFSTNHKFLGTLAESDGRGGWTDLMAATGFSPTPEFPGFEDMLRGPVIDTPGLYIYARARSGEDPEKNPTLHIVANRVSGIPLLPERARGTVTLLSPTVRVKRREGANVRVRREGGRTIIDFTVEEQGHIAIQVFKADVPPIIFDIEQAPLLARTYVGPDKVRALLPRFTLRLIDRHGVAWTDADRDGRLDAFIVRGGLGGGIGDYVGAIHDELLIARVDGSFEDRYASSGLVKGDCRSRLTASVDSDGDGLLDLFSSCKGGTPKLYRALPDGGFGSRSKGLTRVPSEGTYYRWVDLRSDRRPELVVFGKERAVVLRSKGLRRWKVAQRVKLRNGTKLVYGAAVGDFDRDGDPDLFVGAKSGNTLLVNRRRGRLRTVDPRRVGLPRKGSGVSWVDYDNDGRLDLHSIPGGLYRQKRDGTFKRTGIARTRRDAVWGLASWFDLDNDGYRDVATAVRRPGGAADTADRLLLNAREGNRWLQVDLDGRPGNPQGIGARVRIKTGGRTQTAWVGESDTSRFSQGHYRVYFGLGRRARIDRVVVRWPDGQRTQLRNVAADQRLVIGRDG
jgi:hypothetical protein